MNDAKMTQCTITFLPYLPKLFRYTISDDTYMQLNLITDQHEKKTVMGS